LTGNGGRKTKSKVGGLRRRERRGQLPNIVGGPKKEMWGEEPIRVSMSQRKKKLGAKKPGKKKKLKKSMSAPGNQVGWGKKNVASTEKLVFGQK